MFGGGSEHSLDQKHRLHLPRRILAKIPEDEQGKLYLARGLDGCIFLFCPREWERFVEQFTSSLPPGKQKARHFQRLFLASVAEVAIDAQKRVLLPEKLRELAGIDDKVVVNGMGDHVEIWAAGRWVTLEEENTEAFEEAYEQFVNESLGGSE